MTQPVPVDAKQLDWPRKVANAVNRLIGIVSRREGYPFEELAADPASPAKGRTYFNTATNKVRVYDGATWNDLW